MTRPILMTREEGDEFLRKIRESKGVDDRNGQHYDNVQDLSNALNILSDELYTKSTHFLLELIQNADDNKYSTADPRIAFTTTFPNNALQMRIDCNEDGFNKENVKAICRIGASTKAVVDRKRGFIGEKGIGFKSVFKIADTVHISSGPWSFRFDRRKQLGMIAPILESFPSDILPGHTQILLDIREESQAEEINSELREIEPELLIFLRKLKVMEIKTPSRHVTFKSISRNDKDLGGETVTISTTTFQKSRTSASTVRKVRESQYMVIRHRVKGVSAHEKRPGMTESDIVLAFPLDQEKDLERPQYTYAYLPIDDYGFKYLIQADLILVANRESIDYAAEWNKDLRKGIAEAFRKAVHRFNAIPRGSAYSNLRYTWHKFLRARYGTSADFWRKLRTAIQDTLRVDLILESRNKDRTLSYPFCMKYIPHKFRLEGQPLVEDVTREQKGYLSFQYDAGSASMPVELGLLGVTEMTYEDFYKELTTRLADDGAGFLQRKSAQWHAKVSHILHYDGIKHKVAQLSIIPLRDGRWVTSSEKHIFLNNEESNSEVPAGISIFLVDLKACMNEDRRELYQWLGVVPCGRAEVYKMIMELHMNSWITRSDEDLVSDAMYLFNTPSTEYDGNINKLWLLDQDGFRSRKTLYIDVPDGGFTISKYATSTESGIKMLHPTYMEAIKKNSKKPKFVKWLLMHTKVSDLPQFVVNDHGAQVFKFFAENAAPDLLILLRNNWQYYFSSGLQKQTSTSSRGLPYYDSKLLLQKASKVSFKCTDGRYMSLDQTVLPLERLQIAGEILAFLQIPDPGDKRWLDFESLGVITSDNQTFYLRLLKALAASTHSSAKQKSNVQEIYRQLAARSISEADISTLRYEFSQHSLVFLANLQQWVSLRQCVWDAPSCLQSLEKLVNRYQDCRSLFCDKLLLGNATVDHVINELEMLPPTAALTVRKELLLVLNDYIARGAPKSTIRRLKGKKIIPVGYGGSEWEYDLMNYNRNVWYLADRISLRDSFDGKVWLLEFTVEEVRTILPLIMAMDLEDYLLSKAVTETTETVGDPILDPDQTLLLQRRSQYLARLVPGSKKKAPSLLKQLNARLLGLKVWRVATIKLVRRIIRSKSEDIYGREDQGQVVFRDTDTTLDIYLPINAKNDPVIMNCLSKHFIKHCGITNVIHQGLVRPILDYPLSEVNKLLEEQNLDDVGSTSRSPVPDSVFELVASDKAHAARDTPLAAVEQASGRFPDSFAGSDLQSSAKSMSLRQRIPTLDQSISLVRDVAGAADAAPLSITSVSEPRRHIRHHTPDDSNETDQPSDSGVGSNSRRPRSHDMAGESSRESYTTDNFNLDSLRSALPGESSGDVPPLKSDQPSRRPFSRQTRTSTSGNQTGLGNENSTQAIHWKFIGILGESFIDKYMSERLPNWDYSCWTSRNRNEFGHPPFTELERDFADFTYLDTEKSLARLLIAGGYSRAEEWLSDSESSITYHLEVKSTNEACEVPFFMSNNQFDMARGWKLPRNACPSDVYIVLRVFNLNQPGVTPGFKIYIDPWALYLDNGLNFLALDKYAVTPGEGGA